MMNLSLITILSLLTILSQSQSQSPHSLSLSLSEKCNPQDKQVLLKIKEAFNNNYYFASWTPDTDCCDWYIVSCDYNTNRIISLEIFDYNLTGSIPHAVADLPFLETLAIHTTNISGPIPSNLSQLKSLKFLRLSYNSLTGSIPPSLAQLNSLTGLFLDHNKLTGRIPDAFGNLPVSWRSLDLSYNQLSGTIPRAWSSVNLGTIELQRNRIEGDASALFGRNKSIVHVDLSRNMLQFDMSHVEFPDSLEMLLLHHNKIRGALPEGLAALKSLRYMNVSYNRLCGRIPRGGIMQKLHYSSYVHNKCLCGLPLPNCK